MQTLQGQMQHALGELQVTVVRGRDIGGSRGERAVCPYVVVQVEQQLYKTQVRKGAPTLLE